MYCRLPEIRDELEKSIHKTQESLYSLHKEPSGDPRNEIATMLHNFTVDLSRHVEGVADEGGLIQMVRPPLETFRRAIRSTAPSFRPYERKYAKKRILPKAQFLSHEERDEDISHDEVDEIGTMRRGRKATATPPPSTSGNSKKRKLDQIYADDVFERALK